MSITLKDVAHFEGLRVDMFLPNPDGSAREVNALIVTVNEFGLLYRERGKTKVDLASMADVIEIRSAPEEPSSVKVKHLRPLALGKARQHLASDHGYFVSHVGSMSEEDAHKFHLGLDHADLAHDHEG